MTTISLSTETHTKTYTHSYTKTDTHKHAKTHTDKHKYKHKNIQKPILHHKFVTLFIHAAVCVAFIQKWNFDTASVELRILIS